MSIYGEGFYEDVEGWICEDVVCMFCVSENDFWDFFDEQGCFFILVLMFEWKKLVLVFVYVLLKYVQEWLMFIFCLVYGMEGVVFRFWNVYGFGQVLFNFYIGVFVIFVLWFYNGQLLMIFEDGQQCCDFVYVEDVVQVFVLVFDYEKVLGGVYNVGSGQDCSVFEVVELLFQVMNWFMVFEIVGKVCIGDICYCIVDIMKIQQELGYVLKKDFLEGLVEFVEWVVK